MAFRLARSRHLVALLLVTSACAAPACSSAPDAETEALGPKLERETGRPWTLQTDPRSGAIRFLAPNRPLRLTSGGPEEEARAFYTKFGADLGATGSPDELRVTSAERDPQGGTWVRFTHYLPGTNIRMLDAASVTHIDASGAGDAMQPGFRRGLGDLPRVPARTKEDAIAIAKEHAAEKCGKSVASLRVDEPELGVKADEDAPLALVYRVPFRVMESSSCLAPDVDVDAMKGTILAMRETATGVVDPQAKGVRYHAMNELNDVKPLDVTYSRPVFGANHYTLRTESSPTPVRTMRYVSESEEVDIETQNLGFWDADGPPAGAGNGSAVDTHYHVTQGLRWYHDLLGRNGLDGKGGEITAIVHHPLDRGRNASYHPDYKVGPFYWPFAYVRDTMRIGDGGPDPRGVDDWMPLSAGFDIVVHELSHGVIQHTSGLVYHDQSGALNESFADVMGSTAEAWFDHWREPTRDKNLNFIVGERVSYKNIGLRSMIDPEGWTVSPQPSHTGSPMFKPCSTSPEDHCRVHSHSGIPNRAWSLMTFGGVHQQTGVVVAKGVGWDLASHLWYETFTNLRPQATFENAAMAQIAWAHARGPDVLTSVACAWHAVGVIQLGPYASPLIAGLVCQPEKKGPTDPATQPKGPNCDGRASGWACSEHVENTAFECRDGSVVSGSFCETGKRCKKTAPDDFTAVLGPDGKPLCE